MTDDISIAIERLAAALVSDLDHHPQSPREPDSIVSALARLANNAGRIASGGVGGPDGLELVAMSICRDREPSLSESVGQVASALDRIADAIETLAGASAPK